MKKARIGINGFGRIGRLLLRNAVGRDDIDIVGINDVAKLDVLAYLLKYDSAYGPFQGTVTVDGSNLVVNGKPIRFTAIKSPEELPWGEMKVDYVVESTGIFVDSGDPNKDPRRHLKAGAKRVVVSAPAKTKEDVKTIVIGVNHLTYDPAKHTLLSNASCTTNCLAPVAKVVHDNWGIEAGLMTTVHAMTATQKVVDAPVSGADPDKLRSARAASYNIIPSSTGAAKAIGLVIPAVAGKLTGMAFRIPTITGSAVDFCVITQKDTTLDEIASKMEAAANTPLAEGGMKGILEFTKDPIVSTDIIGNRHSSIFDCRACIAFPDNKRFFKLIAWYDNECGYATRLADLLAYMASVEK